MEMTAYQQKAVATQHWPASYRAQQPIDCLIGLAGEAGELINEYNKYLRDGEAYRPFKQRVSEELGDMLWHIAAVANQFDLSLDDIALANLDKWRERCERDGSNPLPVFDATFPESERFPRRFKVTMETVHEEGLSKSRLLVDGEQVGDWLTDNAYENDGYRHHDVFHLACAATLGWSPVTRKILKRKRKSNPRVDEVEDGGRATAIEEGISALVFRYAEDRDHLQGVDCIDYELLRTIRRMTEGLEVGVCTAHDWETILLSACSKLEYTLFHDPLNSPNFNG